MTAPKPDFVFIREKDIEQSNGLMLAGTLITNIPKFRADEASETEKALVVRVIDRLTEEAAAYRLHPEINCIWLDDGGDGPIPDAASLDRWKTVYVDVVVRIAVRAGEGVKLN